MPTKTKPNKLHELQPDPLDPRPEEVEKYMKALQELAEEDPKLAQRHAWDQIRLAGVRHRTNPAEAEDTLNRLFRMGTPPEGLDGPYRGILVTTTTARPSDAIVRSLTSSWMPWEGKRFDSKAESGDNLLVKSARVLSKVLWPGYTLEDSGDGRFAAFKFRTHTDPGKVDPDRQTLKIDYDSDENPGLLIRDILDELVELVPGAYLGKVLLRRGDPGEEKWQLIGYFALQPPEPIRLRKRSAAARKSKSGAKRKPAAKKSKTEPAGATA